jgi:hypothetical protein
VFTGGTAPATSSSLTFPAGATPLTLVAVLGGVLVLIGSFVTWYDGYENNSFDVSGPFLFDTSTTEFDPALGYFLVAFGAVGVLSALFRQLLWVRRACGALAFGAVVLLSIQIDSYASVSFTELFGAAPYLVAAGGAVLALTPSGRPRAVAVPTRGSDGNLPNR